MLDQDQFRIGDLLIDARKIDFQLPANRDKKTVRAIFRWPGALLSKGQVIVQDEVGKALWSRAISPEVLKTRKSKFVLNGQSLRTDLTGIEIFDFDRLVLNRLHLLPFFRFCIHNEENNTQIDLCSKALFFKKREGREFISFRDSLRPDSFVEINGQRVGNQGIVFLQSRTDLISLRAVMLSGATLAIDTQMNDLDLRDLSIGPEKTYILRTAGAEPADPDLIISHENGTWTTRVDAENPSLYIKGEGGIPMRQDLVLGTNIPPQDLKVNLETPSVGKTYSSQETLVLITPKETKLSADDQLTEVQDLGDNRWRWTLKDLRSDLHNVRYVKVTTSTGTYTAAFTFDRTRRTEIFGDVGLNPLIADLRLTTWWGPIWGSRLFYSNFIQANAKESTYANVSAQILYRLTPGLANETRSHLLSLGYEQTQIASSAQPSVSVGGELNWGAPSWFKRWGDELTVRAKMPVLAMTAGTSDTTTSPTSRSEIALRTVKRNWSWEYGLRYEAVHLSTSSATVDMDRTSILAGAGWIF